MGLVVVGTACYIRWSTLTLESIWADEAFSIGLVSQSWLDVVRGTAVDQHPPLYYFLLKLWTVFGWSDFQLRYLSTAFSILEVTLVVAWGRKVLSLQAGLVAGLLLALAPLHVQWAQSVRMYSFVSLLCTLSCIFLYRFIRVRKGLVICALLNLLALYTHNVAIFLVGVQLVLVILFSARYRDWALAKKWLGIHLLVGLAYLPWLTVLYRQATENVMSWANVLTPGLLVVLMTGITSGNAVSRLGSAMSGVWLGCWTLLILYGAWRARAGREPSIYLLTWFFGGLASLFVVSQFVQFFVSKLLIWLLAPLFLLVGHGFQWLPGRWSKVLVAGVMIGPLTSALIVQQVSLDSQDCRGVAQLLGQEISSTDVVLFNAGSTSICVQAYEGRDYAFVTYPEGYSVLESGYHAAKVTPEFAQRMVVRLQEEYQGIWLVEFWPHWFDPGGYLEENIQRSAALEREWEFRGLRVRYFRFTAVQ